MDGENFKSDSHWMTVNCSKAVPNWDYRMMNDFRPLCMPKPERPKSDWNPRDPFVLTEARIRKEQRELEKLAKKLRKEEATKDSQLSKERLKMRLRQKLANKKDAKEMKKDGPTCSEHCPERQKNRYRKKLAAKRKAKLQESELPEEQQQHPQEESHFLHQHGDTYDEEEKEDNQDVGEYEEVKEDIQNNKDQEFNDNEKDGEEFKSHVNTQLPDYSSSSEDVSELVELVQQQYRQNLQEEMEYNSNQNDLLRTNYCDKNQNVNEGDEDEIGFDMQSHDDSSTLMDHKISEEPRKCLGSQVEMFTGEKENHGRLMLQPRDLQGPSTSKELFKGKINWALPQFMMQQPKRLLQGDESGEKQLDEPKEIDLSKFMGYKYHF